MTALGSWIDADEYMKDHIFELWRKIRIYD